MPLVHECAALDCHVVTMGAFCIDHERESFAPIGAAVLEPISDAAAQSRAAGLSPSGDSHRHRTRRPLRALPTSQRLAAHPR
jgi:hypothetical protein